MVDLNFGTNVQSPRIYRDFDPKEDVRLNMSDVATMVKDLGFQPTREWLTDRFDVELEEEEVPVEGEKEGGEEEQPSSQETTQSDGSQENTGDQELDDLIASILGEG